MPVLAAAFFADWMPEGWVLIIGALGLFLGQLGSFIAQLVALARQTEAKADRKELSTKLEGMDKDQKVIHTLVNSQTDKLTTAIANGAAQPAQPPVVVVPSPIPTPLHVVVDMPKPNGDKP